MAGPLRWEHDGRDWPMAQHSSFVQAAGLRWHVQQMGRPPSVAPLVLLVHGTGASAHTWRHLVPLLQERFALMAMDLPGHAFTSEATAGQLSMPGMARALAALLHKLHLQPRLAIGHSAGAAVLVRMALDGLLDVQRIVAINGAFLPFGGVAALLFAPLARLLYAAPFVPRLFSRRAADDAVVQRLISGTGSQLDAAGTALYARLMQSPPHAASALGMMAHWDLRKLADALPRLRTPLQLIVGERDAAVPPRQAQEVAALCPGTQVNTLPRLGHLAHEEDAAAVAERLNLGAIPI